jgi:crotonobetainyl-CoA:carnitine CoA-transferase CaiB-like acyl-CoA transferase
MSIFEGIKVLDVGSFLAAPVATTIFADFGADVIKVEPPGEGDANRLIPMMTNTPKADHNYAWIMASRSKRGLALDLKTDSGKAVLYKLVETADILVTNYPPQLRSRLGLNHDQLKPFNPRLIYAALTGYGETGRDANRPGFDTTAYWARSGLADQVRPDPDASPAPPGLGLGDQPTAAMLYGAIVTALYRREKTGLGACITTSLLASGVWANAPSIQAALCGGTVPYRLPRTRPRNALTCYYKCRDERWFTLTLLAEERQFEPFVRTLEMPGLLTDPRFAKTPERRANAAALVEMLDPVFAKKDSSEWQRLFEGVGIPTGVVARTEDAVHDEQMRLAGAIISAPWVPVTGLTIDSPFRIADVEKALPRPPPEVGQHTDEILLQHGFTPESIVRLRSEGAIA